MKTTIQLLASAFCLLLLNPLTNYAQENTATAEVIAQVLQFEEEEIEEEETVEHKCVCDTSITITEPLECDKCLKTTNCSNCDEVSACKACCTEFHSENHLARNLCIVSCRIN